MSLAQGEGQLAEALAECEMAASDFERESGKGGLCSLCCFFDAGGPWANFDLKPTALRLHCLKRHEDSKGHKLAEQSFQHGTNSRVNLLAPPLSEFRDAWTKMQQGGSCRDGGVSSDKKTNIR